jgi:hypothetical protein
VSDRRDGPDFVGGLPGTNDTVDKYYAEDIRARNGCSLDAQYVPFHQHEARVDQLKAENAALRKSLEKYQAARVLDVGEKQWQHESKRHGAAVAGCCCYTNPRRVQS